MNKTLLIIILSITSFTTYSQVGEKDIRLGTFVYLDKNISSSRVQTNSNEGYLAESNKINYKVGVLAEYFFSSNISLALGVNYANKSFSGEYYCENCGLASSSESETIPFHFLEVPMKIRQYFFKGKYRVFLDLGLMNQISLSNNINNKDYNLAGITGFGMELSLKNNFSLQFTTEYNAGITKQFENSNFKLNFIAFGIGLMKNL